MPRESASYWWGDPTTASDCNFTATDMTNQERYLLRACLNGEKSAWNDFVSIYSKLIWHTIRRTLALYEPRADASLAEEIYQEFFVSLVAENSTKLKQFRGDNNCSLASWLRTLASRLAIDFMRREASRSCRLAAAERFVEDGTVQNLVELEAKALFYRFCIALPKQDRTLLELHFEAELPPSSVARLLGISVNTFYARKSRMVKKLRKTFAAEYL